MVQTLICKRWIKKSKAKMELRWLSEHKEQRSVKDGEELLRITCQPVIYVDGKKKTISENCIFIHYCPNTPHQRLKLYLMKIFSITLIISFSYEYTKMQSKEIQTLRYLPSVQSPSCVQLLVTPWTAACQASLSITNSQSLLKLMSIELVMPSNHLILCHPLLLLHSIFPSSRVFSNESVHRVRWPKYCSFSFSISPSNEYSGLISFMAVQKHQFFNAQLSSQFNSHIHT